MNKTILTLLFLSVISISLLSMASAVTLDLGLNITNSTEGVLLQVDTVPITVDVVDNTAANQVNLTNPSWTSSGLTVNYTGVLTFSSGNTLTSSFPRLTTNTETSRIITSGIQQNITTTLSLTGVDCDTLGTVNYTSGDGSQTRFDIEDYTCTGTTATFTNIELIIGSGNAFITYQDRPYQSVCDTMLGGFNQTALFLGLILLVVAAGAVTFIFYQASQGNDVMDMFDFGDFNMKTIVMIAIIGIALVLLIVIFGMMMTNLGGTYC
jgi:hypothetical protein